MIENNFVFNPENLSKYWKILNNSNDSQERKIANSFLDKFKANCPNCLEISMSLFKSNDLQDKLISSILIYQYIKENPKKILTNKELFNTIKNYIFTQMLIPFTNTSDESNINKNNYNSLIIERICYIMSIIILLGICSYWPEAIDEMLKFGKQTIKHTYLITIIFGNCNNELKDLFLSKKQEFIIKNKFIEKKNEFKDFINTIFLNINIIDQKLYKKTLDLAKNLTTFEVNILHIPNLIKNILNDINPANIDSLSKLLSESINNSKSKKLDEDSDLNINEYDEKINKDELISFSYIIDLIITYVQSHNNYDEDVIFGLGQIFSSITENFVYMFFKKDILSQKIFNLFFFFISHKIRKVSQLFFETIPIIKNFINGNYKFSNYEQNEKIEFLNFLLKILLNIINNCTIKSIKKKQDILLGNEWISINLNNNENNKENEDNYEDNINEVTIEDYRTGAEEVFSNIFEIFSTNYGKEGVNYFFEQITKDVFPLLNKPLNELSEKDILAVEVVIYAIKCIVENFENLDLDRTPLNKLTLLLISSKIILNNFILLNILLLIEIESDIFEYNKTFYSELIIFLLSQLTSKLNENNSEDINRLISTVLLSICNASDGIFIEEIWEKMYQVYFHYYDQFSFLTLYNLTEALSCSLIIQEDESNSEEENKKQNKDFLSNEEIINHFKKIIESPIIRITQIGGIILNKSNSEIYGNKEMENKLRLEIIKNFNALSYVLKQCSFIDDRNIISEIFNLIYNRISESLNIIINEYNKDNEIIHCIMRTLSKSSSSINANYLEQIFPKFNELMIKSFLNNNDNYQCIEVLRNIYSLKLQNIKKKDDSNKDYVEIYNYFLKLNRQICSTIITSSSNYQLELMQSLSSLFVTIFPQLNYIKKEDCVIISDTIILLNEGIKTLCENNIINNILYAFISFIESPNKELIDQTFNEIVNNVFSSFDHFNQKTIISFVSFCNVCLKINKRSFMTILKQILNGQDFKCFNNDKKEIIYNYIDTFSNNGEKMKIIFTILLDIIHKNISESIDDILEKYHKETINNANKGIKKNNLLFS